MTAVAFWESTTERMLRTFSQAAHRRARPRRHRCAAATSGGGTDGPGLTETVRSFHAQDVLGGLEWADFLTPAERRGLAPLFWSHVRPYGEVKLDVDTRLSFAAVTVPGPRTPLDARLSAQRL